VKSQFGICSMAECPKWRMIERESGLEANRA
jgi:hypothetical protein